MKPTEVRVERQAPDGRQAVRLIGRLSAELARRYEGDAGDGTAGFHADEAVPEAGGAFLIAYAGAMAAGCVALRRYADHTAEIKRLYVRPELRGRGIARALVAAIEAEARALGYRGVQLETGLRQPESMALYETCGYHRIPGYGMYQDHPLCVCYAKSLEPEARKAFDDEHAG